MRKKTMSCTRVEILAEIFRYKGVNGSENQPQKPLLAGKIAALTVFNRLNKC